MMFMITTMTTKIKSSHAALAFWGNFKKNVFRRNLRRRKRVFIYALLPAVLFLMCFIAYIAGYRYNLSSSVPKGLWKLHAHEPVYKGDFVAIPPNVNPGMESGVKNGYFHRNSTLLKLIIAGEGDCVDYDVLNERLTVNGQPVPFTKIYSADSRNNPMPVLSFPITLQRGQVWLSSEHQGGFDSRYFGPVSLDALIKATPRWIPE